MTIKRVLIPERIRTVPQQFGWIDRRVLHRDYLGRCDAQALALYAFLTLVADRDGVSFYADGTIERWLSLPLGAVALARAMLVRAGLIAYQAPLYQVLSLDPPPPPRTPGVRSARVTASSVCRASGNNPRRWPR